MLLTPVENPENLLLSIIVPFKKNVKYFSFHLCIV